MLFYLGQILEQSLLMLPLVLGTYISFSVLKIADLSVDGSFVLGAAVYAIMNINGVPFFLAMFLAVLSGATAGAACALIQYRNRIDPLIAGILTSFILHSLSLVVMQRPNIGLLGSRNLFSYVSEIFQWSAFSSRLFALMLLLGFLSLLLSLFLSSSLGIWLRAFGNSQDLVAMLGRNPERLRVLGLALGNGLAALSGCLSAQASGFADINMGFGQALIGIAMILIGRELLHFFIKRDAIQEYLGIFFTLVGVFLYFLLTNELIRYGLSPVYLKMAIGILLIIFLLIASDRATRTRSLTS